MDTTWISIVFSLTVMALALGTVAAWRRLERARSEGFYPLRSQPASTAHVWRLIQAGEKNLAINLYREFAQVGWAEAAEAVKSLAQRGSEAGDVPPTGVEVTRPMSGVEAFPDLQLRPERVPNWPPADWTDRDGWDRYFTGEVKEWGMPTRDNVSRLLSSEARGKGRRIWFPGCGIDPHPASFAERGYQVLVTDFSKFAVKCQERLAEAFRSHSSPASPPGTFAVAEQDFTERGPAGEFDVVINRRAFQGLTAVAMAAAARHFHAALRPGGVCIIETMNVGASSRRNLMEGVLLAAGFYVPYHKTERWYRDQADEMAADPGMVRLPPPGGWKIYHKRRCEKRDALDAEYERRLEDEKAEVRLMLDNPATVVAEVRYGSG